MNARETYLPSSTSRPGSSTTDASKWPQACGRYQAAVRLGAVDFAGLVAKGRLPVMQLAAAAMPLQVPSVLGPIAVLAPVSEANTPTPCPAILVAGVSADTENDAPQKDGIV